MSENRYEFQDFWDAAEDVILDFLAKPGQPGSRQRHTLRRKLDKLSIVYVNLRGREDADNCVVDDVGNVVRMRSFERDHA